MPLLTRPLRPLSFMTSPAMLSYVVWVDVEFLSTPRVGAADATTVGTTLPIA